MIYHRFFYSSSFFMFDLSHLKYPTMFIINYLIQTKDHHLKKSKFEYYL